MTLKKPCPFCGNKAVIEKDFDTSGYVIICDCGLELYSELKDAAINRWNKAVRQEDK